MAFESLDKLPIWQRIVVFLLGTGIVLVVWYFVFYSEAADARSAAERAVTQAAADLEKNKDDKAKFLEAQKEHAAVQKDLEDKVEVLPMSTATVDNLMQTFQQQARLVGMTVETWTTEPEEREEYYARMPIRVKAAGTWPQVGEFFRRVSELDRIVSVDNLTLSERARTADGLAPGDHPILVVEFEAATYRFLSDQERAAEAKGPSRRRQRRKR